MNKTESQARLAALKRRVARIAGTRAATSGHIATGHDGIDCWLGGGLARGRLHEMVGEAAQDAPTIAGFAAMIGLCAGDGVPLLWLRSEAAEKMSGRLHATGLGELGLSPRDLLLGLVPDDGALLKAANDAARCAGLGLLVVESWGDPRVLDLTATRRLLLAAEQSGVTVLLLRLAARESPSAAETRWRIAAAPSTALPGDAPGPPAFDLELLRRRAGPAGRTWRVEWNRERRGFIAGDKAALPGAAFSLATG